MKYKEWDNLDLNQGPTGYEGGGTPTYPATFSRFQTEDKRLLHKKLLVFVR
jgi:hypothetical protein